MDGTDAIVAGWRIVPVNPHADEILGEPAYRTLADLPTPPGLVDLFRPSRQTPDFARQAVAAGSAGWACPRRPPSV